MKYYYDCPIAAAWMAKEFGVRFDIYCAVTGIRTRKDEGDSKKLAMMSRVRHFNVHSDSLHIFEPQAGDLIIRWNGVRTYAVRPEYSKGENTTFWPQDEEMPVSLAKRDIDKSYAKIIQRNNKAFIWPESE